MTRPVIRAWVDRQGRVWMDSGRVSSQSREPIIQLLNGEASGALGWVSKEFGPLDDLSVQKQRADQ